MRRISCLLALALMIAGFAVPVGAQATHGSAYYERTVLEDTPGDYEAHPALDIVAVHAHERFRFDFDRTQVLGPALYLRVEVQDLQELPGFLTVRYHVWTTVAGTPVESWVEVTRSGDEGIGVTSTKDGVGGFVNATSIFLVLPHDPLGLLEGQALESVWAASSTLVGDVRIYHDVAPHDNGGSPAGTEAAPPAQTGSTPVEGPFPFVVLEPLTPLQRLSSQGAPVDFPFRVVPAAGLSGEIVNFYFQWPPGWQVQPTHGDGMPSPFGQMINVGASRSVDYRVTITPPSGATLGTEGVVTMRMVTNSGAHALVDMLTTVASNRIVSDDFDIRLLSGGSPARGETARLEFQVTTADGSPLAEGSLIRADMRRDGRVVDTVPANATGNGTYVAEYVFQQDGLWVVDVYLAHLAPSPHQEFEVEVRSAGVLAPGPGVVLLALALTGAFWVHRRRDG